MKKQLLITALAMALIGFSLFAPSSKAQDGYAGMPGAYLHTGVGARALSMGKAYTALAKDATAIYWNPAGLADQDPFQIYAMHSVLFMDTNLDFFAVTAPTKAMGNFGLGVIAFTSSEFDQRSLLNEELGNFNMADMALMFSWSKMMYRGIAVGINYKLVTQKVLEFSGVGHGMDVGVKTRLLDKLDVGVVVMNAMSPKMTLVEESENFPTQFRFGIASSFMHDKLVVSSDIAQVAGWGAMDFNFGIEYQALDNFALRAGSESGRFTLGVGFSFKQYGIDYSSASVSELGTNHRFAMKYSYGGFGVKATSNPAIFSPLGETNISRIKLNVKSRSAVTKWKLELVDKTGMVVRQFSDEGVIPEELIWDGRDNVGNLVADGKFYYRFEVLACDGKNFYADGLLVTIDTRGPEGVLGSANEN